MNDQQPILIILLIAMIPQYFVITHAISSALKHRERTAPQAERQARGLSPKANDQ